MQAIGKVVAKASNGGVIKIMILKKAQFVRVEISWRALRG